jgi:putative membrane protein
MDLSPSHIRFIPVLAVLAALAIAVTSFSAHAELLPKSAADFVKDAWNGNSFEVSSSQLALERSKDNDVRAFAQSMINDHGKAGQDLKAAVTASTQADKVSVPTKLDSKHQDKLDALKTTSADFDKKYVDAQNDAHDEAVNLFRDYSKNGDDTSLKNFATKTLPVLEEHQRKAADLKNTLKKALAK